MTVVVSPGPGHIDGPGGKSGWHAETRAVLDATSPEAGTATVALLHLTVGRVDPGAPDVDSIAIELTIADLRSIATEANRLADAAIANDPIVRCTARRLSTGRCVLPPDGHARHTDGRYSWGGYGS